LRGAAEHAIGAAGQHLVLLQRQADTALHLAHGFELLAWEGPDLDRIDDLGSLDGVHTEDLRVGDKNVLEGRFVAHFQGDLLQQRDHLVGIGGEVDRDVERADGVVAALVGHIGDLAVGNDVDRAIKASERGLAQGHGIHSAGHPRQGDDVAHVVLVLDQNQDAVQHVFYNGLCRQADSHARDPRAGQERSQVEMENILHNLQEGQKRYDDDAGSADDRGQRAQLGAAHHAQGVPVLSDFHHPAGDEVDHQDERPGIKADKDQLGQAGVEEFLHIGKPFLVQTAQKRRCCLAWVEEGDEGEKGGVHWHPMMVLERWMIAVILGVGLVSTAGAAAGQSSSAKSQTAQPDSTAPAPDQATSDQTKADRAAPIQPAVDQTPADQGMSDKPIEDETPADQAAADQPAADQTPADQATSDKPAADETPADQATSDQPAVDQTPADQATPDQPAADQTPADQATSDKPAADQTPADQAMSDKPAADQTPADKTTSDKPAAGQTTADQATPAKPAVDKPAAYQAKAPAPPPPGSPEEQQLRKDSAYLLQLVQELKAEVEKAGNDTLSLAALRKADEIQKLSKSLKERMKEWGLVSQGKGQ
jgi:hypothetical protein